LADNHAVLGCDHGFILIFCENFEWFCLYFHFTVAKIHVVLK
jgi:hypothetical protein